MGEGPLILDSDSHDNQRQILNPLQFFHSYLVAFLYVFGFCVGCTGFAMIHYLGGGRWGAAQVGGTSIAIPLSTTSVPGEMRWRPG